MEMDSKKTIGEQLTLFDVLNSSVDALTEMSASDLEAAIEKLRKAKRLGAEKREAERRRREQEAQERREREEREKKEAHVREVTCMELPLDWSNAYFADTRAQGVHFESSADALVHCLATLGKVDIEYIASVTGDDCKTVICALKGAIYQNPDTWGECFYKGWETSEEYLSGNLMRKWKSAQQANAEYNGYFSDNLRAIERVLPPTVMAKDIYITLGSPWVPADIIDDFMEHLFGDPLTYLYSYTSEKTVREMYQTVHDERTGTWEIPCKSRYNHSIGVRKTYGTEKLEALHILEKTLNMKTLAVTEEIRCPTNASGKKRVINQAETIAALEKQKKLIEAFQKWVWQDDARKKRLESIFESKFGCVRRRIFDGSFLRFPTMSPAVQLYPYQKDAVARIIFTPNTLLAHDVGAGKTYTMIAAGQELRRMGLSRKNLYVVPNNIVGQWKQIFLTMYPNAKLLCVEPKRFTPGKREAVLRSIRDMDYDGILMAYSCFSQIPLSKAYYIDDLESEMDALSELMSKKGREIASLEREKAAIEKALSELTAAIDDMDNAVYFDELGITRLFVDEAHNFKNVPIETKANAVLGIRSAGSRKCQDMLDKVRMVQKKNDGKGVVFATGTPITNSVTDIYIMQKYLQSGELAMLDLQSFDGWIGMFAEKATGFEIDVDTGSYRLATRFAQFHNLPELTALLASIADFHGAEEAAGIPRIDGYTDACIAKTPGLIAYLNDISQRAEDVRGGVVRRKDDNMLKITTDGRKAALDLRLVAPTAGFTAQSKVARCAENVADIYFKTSPSNSTQLVFCDTSTPKAGFNLYDELKTRLTMLGVPAGQIAFIHHADTETRREQLFAKVRAGNIRVLIGSTFKLGLGVNIQNKLIALHHMDVPWRPADMTQREGRILRQGNENSRVQIFRYITEGSFDAYSWQLLETKQRLITDLLSGSLTERSSADVEDTVLDYAEVKALAVGNPLIKERVEAANELARYRTLQRKLVESRTRLEQELLQLPGKKAHQADLIARCHADAAFYAAWKQSHSAANVPKMQREEERRRLRQQIYAAVRGNVLQTQESHLMDYRGFHILLPANMMLEKPYIWLERSGKYYVALGDTEVGNLIRVDNFLDDLTGHLDGLKLELRKLEAKEAEIKAELAKGESYADEIEKYEKKLAKLDKMLGVTEK